jgi:hypothetical protein
MPMTNILPEFGTGNPPPYKESHTGVEKEKDFQGDWDSVSELDMPRPATMVDKAKI